MYRNKKSLVGAMAFVVTICCLVYGVKELNSSDTTKNKREFMALYPTQQAFEQHYLREKIGDPAKKDASGNIVRAIKAIQEQFVGGAPLRTPPDWYQVPLPNYVPVQTMLAATHDAMRSAKNRYGVDYFKKDREKFTNPWGAQFHRVQYEFVQALAGNGAAAMQSFLTDERKNFMVLIREFDSAIDNRSVDIFSKVNDQIARSYYACIDTIDAVWQSDKGGASLLLDNHTYPYYQILRQETFTEKIQKTLEIQVVNMVDQIMQLLKTCNGVIKMIYRETKGIVDNIHLQKAIFWTDKFWQLILLLSFPKGSTGTFSIVQDGSIIDRLTDITSLASRVDPVERAYNLAKKGE